MLEQETIEHYQKLLGIYRSNLYHLLEQVALHGGISNVSLEIANNLQRTRADIRRAKEILRANGITVADQPGEQEPAEDRSADIRLAAQAYAGHARNRLGLRLIAGMLATLVLLMLWRLSTYSALFLPRLLPATTAEKAGYSISAQVSATDMASWTAAPPARTANPPVIADAMSTQPFAANQGIPHSPVALAASTQTPEPQASISAPESRPTDPPIVAPSVAKVPSNSPTATKEPLKATQVPLQVTPTAAAQLVACVQIDRLYFKPEQLTNIPAGEPRFRVIAIFGPAAGISEERKAANTVPKTAGEDIAGQEIEPQWKICEPINSYIEAGNIVHLQIQAAVITPDSQVHVADISPIEGEMLNLTLQVPQAGADCTIWQAKDNPQALSGNCGRQIQTIGGNAVLLSSDIIPSVGIWFTVTLNTI